MTQAQLDSALLQPGNLGPRFKIKPPKKDKKESDPMPGCLGKLDDLSGGTSTGVSRSFVLIRGALKGCTAVKLRERGFNVDLKVQTNSDKADAALTDQFNMSATGTLSGPGRSVDIGIWYRFMRIDNHVVSVAFTNFDKVPRSNIGALTTAALARFKAVVAGQEPPAPTVVKIVG